MQDENTLISSYLPMSEPGFLLLLFLTKPNHGYALMQMVQEETGGRVCLSSSTVYTLLYKMEQDGLIHVLREVDRRKIYQITDAGKKVLYAEMDRLDDILRLAVRITGDAGLGSAKKEEMRCC